MIFNYLFSENKSRLDEAKKAVQCIYDKAPAGCIFVVIDRLENNRDFSNSVISIFNDIFDAEIAEHTYNRTVDFDEQGEMGEMLREALGSPRFRFFTPSARYPTVFWFTVTKT